MTGPSYKTGLTIEWMNDYFQYGDSQPNGDKVCLSVATKKEVFIEYETDIMRLRDPQSIVDITGFYRIWNNLFPKTRLRSWVTIPGKCDVCMEIDKIRRQRPPPTSIQKQALQDAHILHRGGLIMMERQRYISLFIDEIIINNRSS